MKKQFKVLLEEFQQHLNDIEGVEVIDVVLYGSAVSGDYIEDRGDIDFLVFFKNMITQKQAEALFILHEKYRKQTSKLRQLEGTYYAFNKKHKLINGVYVGTTRRGWKMIKNSIHGNVEQGMILSNYETLNSKIDLKCYFNTDWERINKEIISTIKDLEKQRHNIRDTSFLIYAIQTSARNIYTLKKRGFATKSQAIDYVIQSIKILQDQEILLKIKQLRYPYSKEELDMFQVDELDEILTKLLDILNISTHNTTST